jgi:hypothetical protein
MAWYYYSGKIAIPIEVKKGVSVSVRGGSKFEALEDTKQIEILKQRKVIRLTTPDKKAIPVELLKVPELKIEQVMKPSVFYNTVNVVSEDLNNVQLEEKTTMDSTEISKEIEPDATLSEDSSVRSEKRRRKSGATSTEN